MQGRKTVKADLSTSGSTAAPAPTPWAGPCPHDTRDPLPTRLRSVWVACPFNLQEAKFCQIVHGVNTLFLAKLFPATERDLL